MDIHTTQQEMVSSQRKNLIIATIAIIPASLILATIAPHTSIVITVLFATISFVLIEYFTIIAIYKLSLFLWQSRGLSIACAVGSLLTPVFWVLFVLLLVLTTKSRVAAVVDAAATT